MHTFIYIYIYISRTTISQDVQNRFPVQLAFAKFLSKINGIFLIHFQYHGCSTPSIYIYISYIAGIKIGKYIFPRSRHQVYCHNGAKCWNYASRRKRQTYERMDGQTYVWSDRQTDRQTACPTVCGILKDYQRT